MSSSIRFWPIEVSSASPTLIPIVRVDLDRGARDAVRAGAGRLDGRRGARRHGQAEADPEDGEIADEPVELGRRRPNPVASHRPNALAATPRTRHEALARATRSAHPTDQRADGDRQR